MIRLKPLPPIALTDLRPAFYDVESVTAIEMVSKLYAYLQNMVNDYNSFVTDVNTEIENFENCTDRKIDEFTSCIKNLVDDFIQTIDMKISLQDEAISSAVNYMRDNLVETATQVINQAIDYGNLYVAVTYDEPTEGLNIIVNREDDIDGI